MLVALDEGPGPPIKYQYAELGKLYTVVSQLVRCCDVSSRMQSSINGRCMAGTCGLIMLVMRVIAQWWFTSLLRIKWLTKQPTLSFFAVSKAWNWGFIWFINDRQFYQEYFKFFFFLLSGNPPLQNPYGDPNLTAPVMPVQQLVAEILFVRTSYVKKIIEDCSNSEETVKLLRFCCWENPQFSSTVLSELLWQVNHHRPTSWPTPGVWEQLLKQRDSFLAFRWHTPTHTSLGLIWTCCYRSCLSRTPGKHTGLTGRSVCNRYSAFLFECHHSWAFYFFSFRIHNVLKGIPDDRDGLFDTIQRSKNHYQKRAYQCIKCMVALFSNCSVAYQILQVHRLLGFSFFFQLKTN